MLSKGASSYYGYMLLSSLAAALGRGSFPARGNPSGATLGALLFPSLLGSAFPVIISIVPPWLAARRRAGMAGLLGERRCGAGPGELAELGSCGKAPAHAKV